MQNASIIHYALFSNRNNGLQWAYFVNNCLQSTSMNRRFLNIILLGLETFRYNCIRGQLNSEGGGELHEIKQSRDKTEIGKEIIW